MKLEVSPFWFSEGCVGCDGCEAKRGVRGGNQQ